jgi:hypothetical protein
MSQCEGLDGQCAESWCNCDEVRKMAGSLPASTLLAGVEQLQPKLNKMKDQAMIDAITGGTVEQSKVVALSNAAWHLSMVRMYLQELAS